MKLPTKTLVLVAALCACFALGAQPTLADPAVPPGSTPYWTLNSSGTSASATSTPTPNAEHPEDAALCAGTAYAPDIIIGPSGKELAYSAQQTCSGDYYSQKLCVQLVGIDVYGASETLTSYYCITTAKSVNYVGRAVLCSGANERAFTKYYTRAEGDVEDAGGIQSATRDSSSVSERSLCD
jgi:hypothetical protein